MESAVAQRLRCQRRRAKHRISRLDELTFVQCWNCNCLLTFARRFSQSPLFASGSASVPQSFFTISRCGTNGHFALGFLCASLSSATASCAPVITLVLPNF